MARPIKDGLDYFPLDVDIFENEKIEAIAGEFGIKGELAVIKLLCAVYKKGYFVVWNDLTKATLLKRLPGVSKELLDQIVIRLVTWGFFDEDLFNSAKVLTSENIQAVYFEATKRRKSPKPSLYIINVDNNQQANVVNADINTQSKVKESKVNKSKVKESSKERENGDGIRHSFSVFEKLWLFPNEYQRHDLEFLISEYSDELVVASIKIAGTKDVPKGKAINFITAVLKEWALAGVKTIEQAREYQTKRNDIAKHSHYQKQPTRTEALPSWYGKEQPVGEEKEIQLDADIEARFEAYQARKAANDEANDTGTT